MTKRETKNQKRDRKKAKRNRLTRPTWDQRHVSRLGNSTTAEAVVAKLREGQDGTDPMGGRKVVTQGWNFLYTYGPKRKKGDMHQLSATPETSKADPAFLAAVQEALGAPMDNPAAFMQYTDPASMRRGKTMRWRWIVEEVA